MSFSPVLGFKAFYFLFNVLSLFLYCFKLNFFIDYVKGFIYFSVALKITSFMFI